MEMLRKSVKDFTASLASKASVPGGGSASALAGSLAAALGGMVGELTVGKEKYAAVEPILRELLDEAETLRGRLLDCVEKDAAALAPLAKAYAIPKGDPQRAETLEACLTAAAAPPRRSKRSDWAISCTKSPIRCPADRCSAWPSRGRW